MLADKMLRASSACRQKDCGGGFATRSTGFARCRHATIADGQGRHAGLGECLGLVVRRLPPLAAAAGLFSVGAVLGLSLLIVPGLLFGAVYAVVAPVVVEERVNAIGAFRRASRLTRGARWKIFGIGLLVTLLVWVWQLVGRLLALALFGWSIQASPSALPILWEILFAAMGIGFSAGVQTGLYVELRDWKDGPGAETLNEIFA
jgi:hypothetical protein